MPNKRKPPVVVLREAAKAWADGLSAPVVDSRDSTFAAIDRQLQRAAIAFARTVTSAANDRP